MNVAQLLDRVLKNAGIRSDYALAAQLGVSRQRISHFRAGREIPGDAMAMRLATMADIDAGYVLASMHALRAKRSDERRAWESLAKKATIAASLLITMGIILGYPSIDGQGLAELEELTAYTLCALGLLQLTLATPRHFLSLQRHPCPDLTGNRL